VPVRAEAESYLTLNRPLVLRKEVQPTWGQSVVLIVTHSLSLIAIVALVAVNLHLHGEVAVVSSALSRAVKDNEKEVIANRKRIEAISRAVKAETGRNDASDARTGAIEEYLNK
jgi:hypothetical protein